MQEYAFHLSGLSCDHCEQAVRRVVRALDAHADVHIERQAANPTAHVRVRSSVARSTLAAALAEEGYPEADGA